jgi:spore coat polysaccharide biosynthesis protein SpsF
VLGGKSTGTTGGGLVRILVVVQARVGSSRLPGKVLLPLCGAPLLQRLLERIQSARTRFEIVVATTTSPDDDPIRSLCRRLAVSWISGHPTDLLDRHLQAARVHGADVVVKVPSDCPLVDPAVVDRVLGHFLAAPGRYDFVSNLHPQTYPDGNDVEVMTSDALGAAWREATRPLEREHTTPFFWEHPNRFRVGNVPWESGLDLSRTHRFTVDYPEDYAFVARVYDELWSPTRPVFGLEEILDLLRDRPEIQGINAGLAGVNWYRNHLEELRTIRPEETRVPGVAL